MIKTLDTTKTTQEMIDVNDTYQDFIDVHIKFTDGGECHRIGRNAMGAKYKEMYKFLHSNDLGMFGKNKEIFHLTIT